MKLDNEKLAILKQSMTRMESGREEAVLDSGILIRDYFTGRKKVQWKLSSVAYPKKWYTVSEKKSCS